MSQYRQQEHRHDEYSHHESPDEIKADIEQTRAEMGAKIDRIKQRMDPEQLKAQAQETLNEVLTDTANSISDYVRTNRRQITHSVVDTIKHNPIPAALIGVGLGWMFVETFTSDDRSHDEHRYRSRQFRGGIYQGPAGYGGYNADYASDYDDAGYYSAQRGYDEVGRTYYQDARSSQRDGNGGDNWAENQLHEAKSQAGEMADQARHKAEQMGDQIRHGTEQAGEQVRHGAAAAGRQAQQFGEQVSHQAQQFGHQIGHQAAEAGRQASQMGAQLGNQAQRQAARAGDQVQRSLEEHPLTFGVMALAAGAAIGMLLPQTRAENRMMGETREQLMESGQAVARDMAQRAQHVVEEVQPELEKTVQHVTEDLRQTGRQAYEDVQQTMQKAKEEAKQATQKAQDTAESEGEQAKQKAKAEAAKVGETAKQDMTQTGTSDKTDSSTTGTSAKADTSKSGTTASTTTTGTTSASTMQKKDKENEICD